jgi:hypothetical protein
VCNRHKLDFCTECLADLRFLNQLLYDSEASHSSHNAQKNISLPLLMIIIEAVGDWLGIIANPRFDVTDYVYAESATSSPGELTECLSYLTCYLPRSST